ncbi:MAG TPA: UDP-glucose--hexose-1-phosphate uridylyltransferase [Candidatus Sulfotelmatobacter sp.]
MSLLELQQAPHRRFNPLLREWVLVSPHRTQRPWLGKVDETIPPTRLEYDPACYLCPENERANGAHNPKYTSTFVFENDYAALFANPPRVETNEDALLIAESEAGICRVVCFSPRHSLTIPVMTLLEVRKVVNTWSEQFLELEKVPWVRHIQIFENRGSLMGASNPHPHCQIWANTSIPNIPGRELSSLNEYAAGKKSCLLCDYLRLEFSKEERVVCENDGFAIVVPYWAVWPFETLLLSKRHVAAIDEFSVNESDLLADILRQITTRYDNLFETSFPYSMGFHQRPSDRRLHPEWHFHGHYYPPLLRSATVQKFMVGYELLASPQRDITPEAAAARLRELSAMHYLARG